MDSGWSNSLVLWISNAQHAFSMSLHVPLYFRSVDQSVGDYITLWHHKLIDYNQLWNGLWLWVVSWTIKAVLDYN